jgi:hypothetical protein
MRQYITGALVTLGVLCVIYLFTHIKTVEKRVDCGVVSHATSANKMGEIKYHTILSCDDGYLRDIEGLEYYVLPIGTRTNYTTYNLKWK